MKRHGAQQKVIQEALLNAFDEAALRQMTRYELDCDLDAIAGGVDLQERTYNLVDWSVRNGRLLDLINGALTTNPGNAGLQELRQTWAAWPAASQPKPEEQTSLMEQMSALNRAGVAPVRYSTGSTTTYRSFIGQWFLASLFGLVAGSLVGGFVFWHMEMVVVMAVGGMAGGFGLLAGLGVAAFTGAVFFGAMSGGMQWVVLRRFVAPSYWWVLASVASLALGGAVGLQASHRDLDPTGGILGLATGLALYGLAQWYVLHKTTVSVQGSPLGGEWVLVMFVGWAVGMAVSVFITAVAPMHIEMTIVTAAGMAIGGSVYGASTGAVLFHLLQ